MEMNKKEKEVNKIHFKSMGFTRLGFLIRLHPKSFVNKMMLIHMFGSITQSLLLKSSAIFLMHRY